MKVTVKMPGGGDEKVNSNFVFVLRDATDTERDEAPLVQTCIWGGGFRIYPAESLSVLIDKFSDLALARLRSPGGMPMFVNATLVTDCDDSSPVNDHPNTRSVLIFGSGANAPRVRVRETRAELVLMWEKLKLSTEPFS